MVRFIKIITSPISKYRILKYRGIILDLETQLSKKYGITREDLIRAIEREIKLIESKGSGGRKNRIKLVETEFLKRNFISPKAAEKFLKEAKKRISMTSFWRLRKNLEKKGIIVDSEGNIVS
ncbi:MAG: hypothetical protein AMQ74_00160 [Candidatus Methanofastidiosum methylothiophilum]|uniref:Uncharacterized protein n=1 Tax=Candidatus Methanofastidiosum methylothiophilum TaxID=1705564 RepID=A0A150JA46_9EURY|nr:MAG: hypothetical protein AMQ74_00160 [Candidatus Methanofastidiosum methylthiophilus]